MPRRVVHLIEACLLRHLREGRGERIAIRSGERSVSYAMLAGAVAAGSAWIERELPPGEPLRVASRNQLRVALVTLAALASGRMVFLVDPSAAHPGTGILLADEGDGGGLLGGCEAWLDRPSDPAEIAAGPVDVRVPAFGVFTSGSTGEPKAVLHGHAAPRVTFEAFARGVVGLAAGDVTISTAGLPFVYALGNNLFFPLLAGASCILPPDLLLPTVLGELARHRATVLVAGPWSLEAMLRLAASGSRGEGLDGLRLALSAGEALPVRLFRDWAARFGRPPLDNLGATELFNSFLSNRPGDERAGTLGRAAPGFELRIGGSPPDAGAGGALEVRGGSLALSIGGRETEPGEWHATGDEVRVEGDGRIVFLGRGDDRFKVHGRFVHPVAVERRLLEVAGARECMVVAGTDDHGLARVVARVVPEDPADHGLARRISAHARRALASHERPVRVEIVDSLPRSARGKLERPRRPDGG